MKAKNKVTAGDYLNYDVFLMLNKMSLNHLFKNVEINKMTVERYEIIGEEKHKSAVSAVSRAAVGNIILGPAGLFAGLSAKQKGIYQVGVYFKDGKKSLLELDEKNYKAIIKILF